MSILKPRNQFTGKQRPTKKGNGGRANLTDVAVNAANSLWHQHGRQALAEFRKARRNRGGLKFNTGADALLNEAEKRIVHGRIEAILCLEEDARNYGRRSAVSQEYPTHLVGITEACKIASAVSKQEVQRQRIQHLADQGRLPSVPSPYDGSRLIVREAVIEAFKSGVEDLRGKWERPKDDDDQPRQEAPPVTGGEQKPEETDNDDSLESDTDSDPTDVGQI